MADTEQTRSLNGTRTEHSHNGIALHNGYSSKEGDKDKDKDKDDHHSNSNSNSHSRSHQGDQRRHDRDKHSSRSDRDKDRDRRDKDRDRDKSKSSHRDKDRDRSSAKDKSRSDHSSKDSDRHKSSGDKRDSKSDQHKRDKTSDVKRERSPDRHKSSSGSKDAKSHSSGSKDKDRNDRDKHRSKDEHRSKHSGSSSSKHRGDKHSSKDKSHSSSNRDKSSSSHRESSKGAEKNNSRDDSEENNRSPQHIPTIKAEPSLSEDEVEVENDTVETEDVKPKIEMEYESEEDIPLNMRIKKRKAVDSESEEDKPLSARKISKPKKVKKEVNYDSEDEPPAKKKKSKTPAGKKERGSITETSPTKRKKKQDEEQEVWKWWEEEKVDDGTKWSFLEHKGPLFAPLYERLPKSVVFRYDGKEMHLSETSEEVAGFYARMLENDYTTKSVFNSNFFTDWRKVMTDKEKTVIKDLAKCDFKVMHAYFTDQSEKNRNKSKEEKAALKAKNEEVLKEYGFCTIDGHKEKIGNFRIEPPGLFRGRGEHPKMGMLKKRVEPEHITINCSKDSKVPKPPQGHKWKEVRHDNTVTWLASWTENVQGQVKYVMLNPSSKLKGEKDWQKYETARKLAGCVEKIRETYRDEWKAKEMRIRQRAVALYFIDRLALRAGNEKDEDQADTVGCCSLRVEHIELHKEKDGKEYVVVFDFLGKDSIRYYNEVPVEKRVFKNLELFKENKKTGDDLFDRLNTQTMNEHLRELMPNLTAKVFRTFNASFTLQNQLDLLTEPDSTVEEKILAYNRANRAVAVLCNHQRAVPKGHQKSMEALKEKIQAKRDQLDDAEIELKELQKLARKGSVKEKLNADKKKKALQKLKEQLRKLEVQETDKDENKTIALGTSKLNYLDPRISIAWCKKHGVPIEKIYNKTQRDKFRWAIDMTTVDYVF